MQGQEVLLHTPLSLPDEAPRLTEMLAEQYNEIGINTRIECHDDRYEYARSVAERQFQGLFCFDSSPLEYFPGPEGKARFPFPGSLVAGLP